MICVRGCIADGADVLRVVDGCGTVVALVFVCLYVICAPTSMDAVSCWPLPRGLPCVRSGACTPSFVPTRPLIAEMLLHVRYTAGWLAV